MSPRPEYSPGSLSTPTWAHPGIHDSMTPGSLSVTDARSQERQKPPRKSQLQPHTFHSSPPTPHDKLQCNNPIRWFCASTCIPTCPNVAHPWPGGASSSTLETSSAWHPDWSNPCRPPTPSCLCRYVPLQSPWLARGAHPSAANQSTHVSDPSTPRTCSPRALSSSSRADGSHLLPRHHGPSRIGVPNKPSTQAARQYRKLPGSRKIRPIFVGPAIRGDTESES